MEAAWPKPLAGSVHDSPARAQRGNALSMKKTEDDTAWQNELLCLVNAPFFGFCQQKLNIFIILTVLQPNYQIICRYY
jgi:hypothetical protein